MIRYEGIKIAGKKKPKLKGGIPSWQPSTSGIMNLWLSKKGWVTEHKFHPVRKWRWDWADIQNKIAIEIQGGVWIGGRHTSGSGFVKDMEKYNAGVILGWRLLAYTPQQFKQGLPIADLEQIYKGE